MKIASNGHQLLWVSNGEAVLISGSPPLKAVMVMRWLTIKEKKTFKGEILAVKYGCYIFIKIDQSYSIKVIFDLV